MDFYSEFARYYEDIFTYQQQKMDFLTRWFKEASTLLDVGCGTGQYAGRLNEQGHSCLGIDLDPAMIAVAKERYPEAEFMAYDMLNIAELDRSFDGVFCIGNTAAHIPHDDFREFISHIYNMLNPGGIWLFQVLNWDFILTQESYEFSEIENKEKGIKFIRTYPEISDEQVAFRTNLWKDDRLIFDKTIALFPIKSKNYLEMHEGAGFSLLGQFADFKSTPYDSQKDSANIFVFQKPQGDQG